MEKWQSATPVFLLKTKNTPVDAYQEYLENHFQGRYQPAFIPVLEHRLNQQSLCQVEAYLRRGQFSQHDIDPGLTRYGGIIFTSQRAVEAFATVIMDLRRRNGPIENCLSDDVPLYVVGPATGRSLRLLDLPCPIVGEESGNGDALASFILEHYNDKAKAQGASYSKPNLLFLAGEQRRDVIPKTLQDLALPAEQRIQVDQMAVYETAVMDSFSQCFSNMVMTRLRQRQPQWIVVFSPTGCKVMLQCLGVVNEVAGKIEQLAGMRLGQTKIATIGPTTRDYLVSHFGFEPDVCAPRPSPEGIVTAIVQCEEHIQP